MHEELYWLWFSQVFGLGTRRSHEVLGWAGHPRALYEMDDAALQRAPLAPAERRQLLKRDLGPARAMFQQATGPMKCTVLTPDHPSYPQRLREIYAPPLALFALGNLELLTAPRYMITMVGTRSMSDYGRRAARELAGQLAGMGAIVVSGFAAGIDITCHRAALEAGGDTIAVLACGMDVNYPSEHLADKRLIARRGLLLTEFPFGYRPGRHGTFHTRNRILSGLSMGTVVVQSGRGGGSMITAAHALAQDRDVFAVPGSIFDHASEGCNQLLKQGAKAVLTGYDILEEYEQAYGYPIHRPGGGQPALPQGAAGPVPDYLAPGQAAVYQLLQEKGRTVEELAQLTGQPVEQLLTALTGLEIFGLVQALPGRVFALRPGAPNPG